MPDTTNILLVDELPQSLDELDGILSPLDQHLIRAKSSAEALRFLLKNEAAVILIDLDKPDADGLQTARLIREREKTRHTPIIFLTSAAGGEGYSLGGVDYILKPIVGDVLRAKVSTFVQMFKQRQELQRQSALLRAERDFADAILDTAATFILVLDGFGRILRANRAFEQGSGYQFEEVRGRHLYELLEDNAAARDFLRQARGQQDCQEYWLTNGTTRVLVSWCCTALSKELTGSGRFVVTGRDMTELRERSEELEGFTYSVSHDMRAPVRAIDGFTRILIEEYAGSLDDEGRRLLDIVRQNTEKMGQLIDGLLALSRLGREKLIFSEIEMDELAKAAFDEQKAAGGKNRSVQLKIGELPAAFGDKRLITQVFQNLFANAIKFTRNEPVSEIEAGYQSGAGEDVYYVRDNGVGFDMNHAQKLFGTFQRLHAANEFEGSGIGLATVRRIIERHGGRVWAEAELNKGATFYFTLPVREQRRAG